MVLQERAWIFNAQKKEDERDQEKDEIWNR